MYIQREVPQIKTQQSLYSKSQQIDSTESAEINQEEQKAAEELLRQLQEEWPDAKIQIAPFSDPSNLKDYAKENLGAFQILLTPKVLKKMMQDDQFKEQAITEINRARAEQLKKIRTAERSGKNIFGTGILLDESGQTKQWLAHTAAPSPLSHTSYDTYQRQQREQEERYGKTKKENEWMLPKKKASYTPALDLARIARSRNQQEVKGAISGVRRKIYQLKLNKDDKDNARILIGQAEQVLRKAKIKIKKLDEEHLLSTAAKKAAAREQLKKAMQLKRMLEERQVKRQTRERTQIHDYYPSPNDYKRQDDYFEENSNAALTAITGTVPTTAPVLTALPTASIPPADMVGMTIDISI